MATATEQIILLYPWLPAAAIEAYDTAYRAGSVKPWLDVRSDPLYETWFPGNTTENGEVRYGEGDYSRVRAGYNDVLSSMGLNNSTGLWDDKITAAMQGERSVDEFERAAGEVYDRVISQSDAIKQVYADNFEIDMTTEAILASVLDPELGDRIIGQEISMAEIGGAAAEQGFSLTQARQGEIAAQGLTLDQAREVYGQAGSALPILDILAARHDDPDDDFDLNEFEQAEIFSDPFQRRRMRRLLGQERASFGAGPSARSQRGGLTGLTQE